MALQVPEIKKTYMITAQIPGRPDMTIQAQGSDPMEVLGRALGPVIDHALVVSQKSDKAVLSMSSIIITAEEKKGL